MRAFQVIVIVFILTAARVAVAADTVPPQNDHQFCRIIPAARRARYQPAIFSGAGPGGRRVSRHRDGACGGARGGALQPRRGGGSRYHRLRQSALAPTRRGKVMLRGQLRR